MLSKMPPDCTTGHALGGGGDGGGGEATDTAVDAAVVAAALCVFVTLVPWLAGQTVVKSRRVFLPPSL